GGGPSLAVGMARIFAGILGGGLMAFWYHFAIMFEAVFILTVLDSGTRVIRFVIQELLDDLSVIRGGVEGEIRTPAVWLTSGFAVIGWGAILSWGILDAQGGTRALIRMFGTANQLLAVIALTLATVIMLKKHRKFAWVTGIPALVVATITLTASTMTIFSSDPRVGAMGAIAAASKSAASGVSAGVVSAANVIIKNAYITAMLTGILLAVVLMVLWLSISEIRRILHMPVTGEPTS
ncbi:MAG: carbon starvation CstA 5TM domain-containing protein, partial [Chthonomonadales bacterium]